MPVIQRKAVMRDGFPVRFGARARSVAQHPNNNVDFAPAVMRGAFFALFHSPARIYGLIFPFVFRTSVFLFSVFSAI
ncbi:hypothetical protein [Pantoea sp.]|uniref:hypothetical protein n=1 Tax=Pantoea sp. TaxID=69393 RepID=UPI0028A05775|nr:hypothetical protein [Pantoea sp.]